MRAQDLTESEGLLWEEFPRGGSVDLRTGDADLDNPRVGAGWESDRTIRADVIRALLLGGREPERGTVPAVRLLGARIIGPLDLVHADFSCPVHLERCWFEQVPDLRWAAARYLDLSGSNLPGILADNVRVEEDLVISGCQINGAVALYCARITGDLVLRASYVDNPSGWALNVAGATVTGAVFMDDLTVNGKIRLLDTHVSSDLYLSKARLSNPGGVAFEGSRLTVGGAVFCREGFTCNGEMRLRRVHITGFLDFVESRLSNPGRDALFAPGIAVDGGLTCGDRSAFGGRVVLDHARIVPDLDLTGAWLEQTGDSLTCAYLAAEQLRLPKAPVSGAVDLSHAQLGILEANPQSSPAGIRANELTYATLTPLLPARERIKWFSHQAAYLPQPYEQLAAAYRRIGNDADARSVLLAKERRRRQDLPLAARLWGILQDVTTGYGYRPGRAGLWLIALLALGTAVFGLHPPAPIRSSGVPAFNPFFYTADLLLPVGRYGQQAAFGPKGAYQWIAYGFMTAGWLLATTIITGITRALYRS
jgi:hypothetical protein